MQNVLWCAVFHLSTYTARYSQYFSSLVIWYIHVYKLLVTWRQSKVVTSKVSYITRKWFWTVCCLSNISNRCLRVSSSNCRRHITHCRDLPSFNSKHRITPDFYLVWTDVPSQPFARSWERSLVISLKYSIIVGEICFAVTNSGLKLVM